jgi:hypothetical protein
MVLFNGTLSVVELLTVIASKSLYLAGGVFFSTANSSVLVLVYPL